MTGHSTYGVRSTLAARNSSNPSRGSLDQARVMACQATQARSAQSTGAISRAVQLRQVCRKRMSAIIASPAPAREAGAVLSGRSTRCAQATNR